MKDPLIILMKPRVEKSANPSLSQVGAIGSPLQTSGAGRTFLKKTPELSRNLGILTLWV